VECPLREFSPQRGELEGGEQSGWALHLESVEKRHPTYLGDSLSRPADLREVHISTGP